MMCSSATALHALNKARLKPGESVAIFGFGGLGFSALQLARALDCGGVYVVEINRAKLTSAAKLGVVAIRRKRGRSRGANQRSDWRKRRGCFGRANRLSENDATSCAMFGLARSRGACRINCRVNVDLALP